MIVYSTIDVMVITGGSLLTNRLLTIQGICCKTTNKAGVFAMLNPAETLIASVYYLNIYT